MDLSTSFNFTFIEDYAVEMLQNFNNGLKPLDHYWWYILPASLALYFSYKIFRPYFPVRVNCWFCKTNQIVPYSKRHGFNCYSTSCGQYNGFMADGDYNKVIHEQYCQQDSPSHLGHWYSIREPNGDSSSAATLCNECSMKQKRKVDKLACFIPTREDYWQQEYQSYSRRLEQIYQLCGTCRQMTALLLQEQDEHIKNMYSEILERKKTSPPASRSGKPHIQSPLSGAEKQRSHLPNKANRNSLTRSGFFGETKKINGAWSFLLKSIKVTNKLVNFFTSLVILFHLVCECSGSKSSVILWIAEHPPITDVIRSLMRCINSVYLVGIATQYFGTRGHRRCGYHLAGFLAWLVTSSLAYKVSCLCGAGGSHLQKSLVAIAVLNSLLSVVCFSLEIFPYRCLDHLESQRSHRAQKSSKCDTTRHQHKEAQIDGMTAGDPPMHADEQNNLCNAMDVTFKNKSPGTASNGSFQFFNYNVRAEEFKERLNNTPHKPRPLISPPKFSAGVQPNRTTFGLGISGNA